MTKGAVFQEARFWQKTRVVVGGCLEWTGCVAGGYGRVRWNGRSTAATHVAFFLAHGRWPATGMHLLHDCDNPRCVASGHLREGTHRDNMADKVERQRQVRGEAVNTTKLTEAQVISIRARYAAGESQRKLGAEFGVSGPSCIYAIVNRKSWKHLP